jgi:hypothetical protein
LNDRHARAYDVLAGERSRDIARNLNFASATESDRCLACHADARAGVQERRFGVGCEACHGAAEKWLGPHTAASWRNLCPKDKGDQAMVPVAEPFEWAQTCVGCHVGAARTGDIPARDVNHDLIAAGHPRLNFELTEFLANMPPHWRSHPEEPMHLWAVGQAVSAKAAVKLLEYRAAPPADDLRPWPELAEYNCFACHHELTPSSWRRDPDARADRRPPGSLAWGTWYYPMALALAEQLPLPAGGQDSSAFRALLGELRQLMEQDRPDALRVRDRAERAGKLLGDWGPRLAGATYNGQEARRLLNAFASTGRGLPGPDWDGAAQLYLSLKALDMAYREDLRRSGVTPSPADVRAGLAIDSLRNRLAFPPAGDKVQYDSPKEYAPARFDGDLKTIREALTPSHR